MNEINREAIRILEEAVQALASLIAQLQNHLSNSSFEASREARVREAWSLVEDQQWLELRIVRLRKNDERWRLPEERLSERLRTLSARARSRARELSPEDCVQLAEALVRSANRVLEAGDESARFHRIEQAGEPEVHPNHAPNVPNWPPDPEPKLPPAQPRRIQAQVRPIWRSGNGVRRDDPSRRSLRVGAEHEVAVRIGIVDDSWVALPTAFPEEKLSPSTRTHQLTVVFVEPNFAPTPQVATVTLPERGNSKVARFRFTAPEAPSELRARITVLHGNRVLQTALLSAPIVADPRRAPRSGAVTLEPETFIALSLDHLDDRTKFDVALVLNHVGEEPQATAVAGEYASLIALRDAGTFVAAIAEELSRVASAEESFAGLGAEATRKLFFFLASQGSLLHETILDGASPQLRATLQDARAVQIVAAKKGDMIPLELAYAFTAPRNDAKVCLPGCEALATGAARCPARL